MTPLHTALAALVAVIWGLSFVATVWGLESFTAPQLTALRFIVACLPVLFVPRPPLAWRHLVALGLFLFTGQFLLLHFALLAGMPPGLAAIIAHTQVFFTILFAALALGERPGARQMAGIAVCFAGLGCIALTVGNGSLTWFALSLSVMGAVSWGIGNVLLKRLPRVDTGALMVWLSLVPPLPALALSFAVGDEGTIVGAVLSASWLSIGSVLFLGLVATIFGFGVWGTLLRLYPAAQVTPFALLAPCTAVVSSAIVFGERFGPWRLAGMVLILTGLAVTVLSRQHLARLRQALRPGRGASRSTGP